MLEARAEMALYRSGVFAASAFGSVDRGQPGVAVFSLRGAPVPGVARIWERG
jgi:hypothetical protein